MKFNFFVCFGNVIIWTHITLRIVHYKLDINKVKIVYNFNYCMLQITSRSCRIFLYKVKVVFLDVSNKKYSYYRSVKNQFAWTSCNLSVNR